MKGIIGEVGVFPVNRKKMQVGISVMLLTVIMSLACIFLCPENKAFAYCYSILLFGTIFSFLISKKRMLLFEPIVLFSCMYMIISVASFYLLYTDFSKNEFINATTYSRSIYELFEESMFYYFWGYIFSLLGYYFVKTKREFKTIVFESKQMISERAIDILTVVFSGVGIANFVINVLLYARGNLVVYMMNVSQRAVEFANGGTTLGYNFIYFAVYLYTYKLLRDERKFNIRWGVLLIVALVIKASVGRIFSTLIFVGNVLGVLYFYKYSIEKKTSNKFYAVCGGGIGVFGIIFYILRMISLMNVRGQMTQGFKVTFVSAINKLVYVAFDRGYAPNIALMPKIVDAWKTEFGFLYGETFFSSLYQYLPSGLTKSIVSPAITMRYEWYSSVGSGNLPPTGVGEMYINFGPLGVMLGMFLFGMLMALVYNLISYSRNYWFVLIGVEITLSFIMMYAKNDFSNFPVWNVVTWLFYVVILIVLTQILKKPNVMNGS